MINRFTQEQFLEKSKDKHGNKYDYSLVEYKNSTTKVKILCPVHGIYEQRPFCHYNVGRGCPMCMQNYTLTTKSFIEKAKSVHNDKYDYTLVNYVKSHSNIIIICPRHGEFTQRPSSHLTGANCPKCAIIKGFKKFDTTIKNRKQNFSHITPPKGSRIIPLTQGKYALVDEEDYERVNQHNWQFTIPHKGLTEGYAKTDKTGDSRSTIKMHRFIMKIDDGNLDVDHINHDGLDNRKVNLRICNRQQNTWNTRVRKRNTTGLKYKGVKQVKNKWVASFEGKSLGIYDTDIEAAKVYDAKASAVRGEFAYLNFKE